MIYIKTLKMQIKRKTRKAIDFKSLRLTCSDISQVI